MVVVDSRHYRVLKGPQKGIIKRRPRKSTITALSKREQRDIYIEVESNALNESGMNRNKARRLVKNKTWLSNEAHDIALRERFSKSKTKQLRSFLFTEFG
ncbi:MAG: hypothetical protein V3U02_00170 [Calditrichia bacterium]